MRTKEERKMVRKKKLIGIRESQKTKKALIFFSTNEVKNDVTKEKMI